MGYAYVHFDKQETACEMVEMLKKRGEQTVKLYDLSRADMADVIEAAYQYDRLVLMAASYDAGVFPCMEDLLCHLVSKKFQKRKVGIVENGSWAPTAARVIKAKLGEMKDITIAEPVVTIKSTLNAESRAEMEKLADAMMAE